MFFYFQDSIGSFTQIMKEWGFPILALVVLVVAIKRFGKWAAPQVEKFLERYHKTQDLFIEQLQKTNDRAAQDQNEYIESIKSQRREHIESLRTNTELMATAVDRNTKAIDTLSDLVRKEVTARGETK